MSGPVVLWGSLRGRQYGSPVDRRLAALEAAAGRFVVKLRVVVAPTFERAARELREIVEAGR